MAVFWRYLFRFVPKDQRDRALMGWTVVVVIPAPPGSASTFAVKTFYLHVPW